jgi:hypothetical protein
MKRELRFLPSARAGMPELAGAGDRFVKRREPSHPALRATISRVGWSPGVPFGMENSLLASRPPARYRRGAPVPPEHHSSTTSGDGARLSASGVARVGLRFRASMAAATSDHTLVESVRLLEMEGELRETSWLSSCTPALLKPDDINYSTSGRQKGQNKISAPGTRLGSGDGNRPF